MLHRVGRIALLGMCGLALVAPPARSQDLSAQEKAEVLALSRRIDEYLAKRCQEAGLSPAPRAEDAVYFRRLNLDLAGKIPSLLDVRDFLDDNSADKRWLWTERLLANDAFARHMGHVWRQIMLGNVQNQQFRFLTPSFEGWVREQFQKNVRLDAMTRELLTSNAAQNIFQRGMQQQGNSPAAFFVNAENKPENVATATSRAFLGIKLDCAQCHAHPFASWTRDQFWEFAAFFSGQQAMVPGQRPMPNPGGGREIKIPNTDKVVKAKFLTGQEPKWDGPPGMSNSRQVVADWVAAADNPYFARAMVDHVWTYLMGASLLEPIVEPGEGRVAHVELLDALARELVAHKFDVKFLFRAILHSEAYQRSSVGGATAEDYLFFAHRAVRALTPEQVFDSIAEATDYRDPNAQIMNPNFNDFNQPRTPRNEVQAKFMTQDPRDEPQTSILQALFLMNGKFLGERTKLENNTALQTLARQPTPTARKVETLYMMVLSRPPRPEESERAVRYVERGGPSQGQSLSDLYWALLNSGEFLLNH